MRKLIPLFILTFLLYFAISNWSTPFSNFDTKSYKDIGILTLKGVSIYPDPAISRHPYLPFFLYFEAATQAVSSLINIPQILIIKFILSLFHITSVYAVYLLAKKNVKPTILYALNPISILVTAFHGQFDIIPVTCILFSILAVQNKQFLKSIILLSLAITIKTWPILFILPFLKRMPKKYWLSIFILPSVFLLLYSIVFHTSLFSILRVLIVYQGVGGIWGFGKLLSLISASKIVLIVYKLLFVGGVLYYSFKQKKKIIIEELFELFLLFFIFTPGFGVQWFIWLTPFLFLTKKPYNYLFIMAISICISLSYLSWIPNISINSSAANTILLLLWPLFVLYFFLFYILSLHLIKIKK